MIEENNYILKNPLYYLKWLSDKLNTLSISMVVILMFSMTIIVLAQVFFRFVLNNALTWAEEISRYLMIWICFLGSGIACKYGEHIGVNFILERFPKKIQTFISFLTNICILIFLYFCIRKSFTLAQFVINQKSAAARISMAWAYWAVPVGCIIMAVHVILALFENPKKSLVKSRIMIN
jgi:TRAP-type C4-dicarboxylate transport system permease small subunit